MSPSPSPLQSASQQAALHDLFKKEQYQVKVAAATSAATSAVLSERRTGQEPLFYWREMDQITRLLIRGQSCFETRLLLRFLSLAVAVVSFSEFSSFLDAVRVYLKARVPPSIVSSTHRIMTADGCATHNKLFVLIVSWDGS